MTPFSTSAFFVSVVSCAFSVIFGTHYPDVIYADELCNNGYVVRSDVRIKVTRKIILDGGISCPLHLNAPNGMNLAVRFLDYSMNSDYYNEYGTCSDVFIQLFDYQQSSLLGNYGKYCSKYTPQPPIGNQFELGPNGEFYFETKKYYSVVVPDIELLVTEVTFSEPNTNSPCPGGFFNCQTGYCVNKDVTCNGYDDCGNNRDEIEGCGLTPLIIGVIVAGVIVFLVIVIVSSLLFRRYRRRASYVQHL